MQQKLWFTKYSIPSLLFLLGIVLGVAAVIRLDSTFRFSSFDIRGLTKSEKNNVVSIIKNQRTLTTSCTEIQKTIKKNIPSLSGSTCNIQYPSKLYFVGTKATPYAYLKTDAGYITLSKKAMVLSKERSLTTPPPFISFFQSIPHSQYQSGETITFSAIQRALYFVSLLDEIGYGVETVAIDSVDMIACKTKGFEVVFSQSRATELQANEVRQIVRQLKAGALKIVRLDLRFDKPVVQLPKK